MDSYEASRTVFSRIQNLEPETASKIMGFLLIQDYGEKEMIRLAFGPETLLQSLIFKAKTNLGLFTKSLSSSSSSPSSSAHSLNPISRPSPLSIPSPNAWSVSGFSNSQASSPSLSYASVLNRTSSNCNNNGDSLSFSASDDEVFEKSPHWGANGEFGFRPCVYYQRGFCKNDDTCRFVHGDESELEQCQELMRLKAAQQQKLASQFMLMQQQIDSQRSPTGSMMMGDELNKFGRCRFDRNEIVNPSSRQIYLTFPADSTFREEDVSNYFSIYGPVHDVRIPYQQKRMFGFVTFVYSETVKLILAKGNPHFVCDSRVLVKPYKEKGKIVEKKHHHHHNHNQHQFDNGDYSLCSSPSALDYDLPHGPRMYYNTQEMIMMKKLEERAKFEQAIELHGRRLMNLQLVDPKKHQYRHGQFNRSFSMGSSVPSPTALPFSPTNRAVVFPSEESQEALKETKTEESDLNESIEHILPDSLFASPKKSATADVSTPFSMPEEPSDINNASLLNITSPESVFSKCSGFLLGMEPLECN